MAQGDSFLEGSETAIIYQCVKHKNAADRVVPFKAKCTKHMFPKEQICYLDYDEDVLHVFRVVVFESKI